MTTVGALALLAALVQQSPTASPRRDSVLAHRLTMAALDQEALLHLDSAIGLYRAARRADSMDVTAEFYYMVAMQQQLRYATLLREYGGAGGAGAMNPRLCWYRDVMLSVDHREIPQPAADARGAAGRSAACSAATIALEASRTDSMSLAAAARAARAAPAVLQVWSNYAKLLTRAGQYARADSVLAEGERSVGHAQPRTDLTEGRIAMRLARGDTAGAVALHRMLRAAVYRDGRPGIVARYLGVLIMAPFLSPSESENGDPRRHMEEILAAAGDWSDQTRSMLGQAKDLIDHGKPLTAVPILSEVVRVADSVGLPDLGMMAHTMRGRAYTRTGKLVEAERDLLRATELSGHAARRYYRALAWQDLASLYESQGRWPEASHAVNQFVTLTNVMHDGLRIAALSAAGTIDWKAGWHASARAKWEEMVRVINQFQDTWDFAAEYFERIGDLTTARLYYARELAVARRAGPVSEGVFEPIAGLVRVFRQLGQLDSAEAWARVHDSYPEGWWLREVPLLPDVLMQRGRPLAAIRSARDWSERQIRGGNTEGATLADLQLARLLLAADQADSALAVARRADSLATAVRLTAEIITARIDQGRALQRLGRKTSSLRVLGDAAILANQHPTSDNVFEAHLALGDALASAGNADGALAAYDRAAREVEHVTGGLSADLERAGFRERHLRPFEGATRVLLRATARPIQLDDLIRWSSRRTAAALALSATGSSGRFVMSAPAPRLVDVQQRLMPSEILLDYLVIDSTVAVLAVTRDTARLVHLPITAGALRGGVDRLRRPLVTTHGGRLDLARTQFDAATAADLYSALISPLSALLKGKQRLLIIPDGPLHGLAFDAMVSARPTAIAAATGDEPVRYLLDGFEVTYLPSPAFLTGSSARTRSASLAAVRLLAVGYGAPSGEAELAGMRQIWPASHTTMLEGSSATEQAVKRAMGRFGIVHFAVHAQADTRDALASNLRLAADSGDDGFLHVNEIANQRLDGSLIVLSACETDAGPVLESEGVMGLARAFLVSGAGSVVATQWPIGSETAVLMREFYRRLAAGDHPSAALRAAQLLLRQSSRTAHPFYWAGFELIVRH